MTRKKGIGEEKSNEVKSDREETEDKRVEKQSQEKQIREIEERESSKEKEIYIFTLKIPSDRIAALIGKNGETKKEIESETGCKLQIDSKEGEVHIQSADSIKLYNTKEIVKAVGRGFNPKIAMLLLKPDYMLDVIELRPLLKSTSHMKRMKGRVIGEGGKCRKTIEDLTDTSVSVYGKTIAIIGEASKVGIARRAIESLLRGSPHSTVYNWLEKQRKHIKEEDFLNGFETTEKTEFEDLKKRDDK